MPINKQRSSENHIFMEMVWIDPGNFQMGNTNSGIDGYNDGIVHMVNITQGFYMGKYEVTQEQYEIVMENNPSYFSSGGDFPVEWVTWYDAAAFCNKLSETEGFSPVYTITGLNKNGDHIIAASVSADWTSNGYRLPTEAEWEYAAKGGNGSPGNFIYSGSNTVGEAGWYDGNNNPYGTKPVGTKEANILGIYDMSGNVYEWCWDLCEDYTSDAKTDPKGASTGYGRVIRGGSWHSYPQCLRSAYRPSGGAFPDSRGEDLGFRIARSC